MEEEQASDHKYKMGDVVRLRSGGPNMTVQGYTDLGTGEIVSCQWFDRAEKLQKGNFREDALQGVDVDASPVIA